MKRIVYKHTQCYPSLVQLAGLILNRNSSFQEIHYSANQMLRL